MAGKLFIVPTPVGNLEDMSFRAVSVLRDADLILAEDTRTSSVLFRHYDIHGQLMSHHKFNEHQTVGMIREQILSGKNVALVSDAGTPGISDPGFLLSRSCSGAGIEVQTLPGPTACIPAVVSSGLPCDRFCFEGFLPQKKGRRSLLDRLADEERTMIFYESPGRLIRTLEQFGTVFGADRQICVSREISKVHEQHSRGSIAEVLGHFRKEEPRGEIVIVVSGKPAAVRGEHKNKYRDEEGERGEVQSEES